MISIGEGIQIGILLVGIVSMFVTMRMNQASIRRDLGGVVKVVTEQGEQIGEIRDVLIARGDIQIQGVKRQRTKTPMAGVPTKNGSDEETPQ